jgi:hypothetical protein
MVSDHMIHRIPHHQFYGNRALWKSEPSSAQDKGFAVYSSSVITGKQRQREPVPLKMASGERQAHASHRVPQDPLGFGRRSPVNLERARNDLPKRLYEASGPHLLSFDGPRTGPVTGATVHLSTLQRMCLRELQAELVDVVTQIFRDKRATKQKMEDARDLLQKFSTASSPVSCINMWNLIYILH